MGHFLDTATRRARSSRGESAMTTVPAPDGSRVLVVEETIAGLLRLRDHSRPCEHGWLNGHYCDDMVWCDGGQAYRVLDVVTEVIEGWRHDALGYAYVVEEIP